MRRLVAAYRALVRWFGVQFLLTFGIGFIAGLLGLGRGPEIQGIQGLATLGSIVPLAIYAHRTAAALGSPVSFLWGIGMVVPLINMITLLILSSRASRACRAAGVPVGFLGPKRFPDVAG
ncbi:MAG TPA: hypothetical protein VFV75_17670 [Candidatus Polarisedimenticolaceae bacterium]|nr:hypothetical protein [Candidatus Polarisedimenticolaceae bacterium]